MKTGSLNERPASLTLAASYDGALGGGKSSTLRMLLFCVVGQGDKISQM